jgi:hypothetical protein
MLAQYGERCTNGWEGIKVAEQVWLPKISDSQNGLARRVFSGDKKRQISVSAIAKRFDISCGSAYFVMHNIITYCEVCARWDPIYLTGEQLTADIMIKSIF